MATGKVTLEREGRASRAVTHSRAVEGLQSTTDAVDISEDIRGTSVATRGISGYGIQVVDGRRMKNGETWQLQAGRIAC